MTGNNDVLTRMQNKKDKLLRYLKSSKEDPEMEKLWDMFIWIEDKLRAMHRRNVVNVVMKKYDVNRSWANRLVNETMAFTGMAHKPDLDYLKMVHLDAIQLDIKLARESQNFKVLPALYKELRLWMFPAGESAIDMDKLQLHLFDITMNLNGEAAAVPLEVFYKLKETDRKSIEESTSEEEFTSWEEIKAQLNDKKGA